MEKGFVRLVAIFLLVTALGLAVKLIPREEAAHGGAGVPPAGAPAGHGAAGGAVHGPET